LFLFFGYFETGSHSVAQAGLKVAILRPQPRECWDYRREPPGWLLTEFYSEIVIDPRQL
jgi:hypothetical protein